jgi:hypothetical protein
MKKVMQISRMKTNLSPAERQAFYAELDRFYASPPKDLLVEADYVAVDQSCSFTLLKVPSLERLHEINRPFVPFVDYQVVEVRPATQKAS